MSKEPSRHQYSSKLTYQQNVPAFLQRLQNKVTGGADEEDDEYEYDGSGRPPIPKRPAIPTRPDDDPGSADEEQEDRDDEAPQIVVLKEGKHLSEREVENEKRAAKGLPPLPDADEGSAPAGEHEAAARPKEAAKAKGPALSFSSGGSAAKSTAKKRKVVDSADDKDGGAAASKPAKSSKKPKKQQKKLLSFGDDA
ncbi:DUF4604 domain-containing protein [Phanerochaete sordida]|uniref:DUF4604 domain-containing protein n=1 Tax=Phanerochaete sordida TaxID=48140 RepID=A0A9P3L911_9APHY|nr:DUF4604 domain-containing protein [Phanerochaete sordida]